MNRAMIKIRFSSQVKTQNLEANQRDVEGILMVYRIHIFDSKSNHDIAFLRKKSWL